MWNVPTTFNKETINPADQLGLPISLDPGHLHRWVTNQPLFCAKNETGLLYMFKGIRRFGIRTAMKVKTHFRFSLEKSIRCWRLEDMDIPEISHRCLRAILYSTDHDIDRNTWLQLSCYSFPVVFVFVFAKRRPRTPINRDVRPIIEISAWFSSSQIPCRILPVCMYKYKGILITNLDF